jgi:hypothetical protein
MVHPQIQGIVSFDRFKSYNFTDCLIPFDSEWWRSAAKRWGRGEEGFHRLATGGYERQVATG